MLSFSAGLESEPRAKFQLCMTSFSDQLLPGCTCKDAAAAASCLALFTPQAPCFTFEYKRVRLKQPGLRSSSNVPLTSSCCPGLGRALSPATATLPNPCPGKTHSTCVIMVLVAVLCHAVI